MAGLNASEIRVAGTGTIYVAPVHTAAPADFSAGAWDAPWVNLGYTTSDGVKFIRKDKLDPVDTWQSVAPIRFVFSDRDFSVKFALLQINADTLPFFFSGRALDAGATSFALAAAPTVEERALGIEFHDGPDVTHRLHIPRGAVTETDETAVTRTSAIKLGVTFTALTPINGEFEPLAVWSMKPPATASEDAEQPA
ncbi:phage tail protein [Actinophytocola oryzae]|uniref:Phage tail protein n=1 Tax=Actinophytocola oryzae TaxID=502181 RepID=A0A4R7VFG2_9PSEU|nr:phage tail protein [Actinophytocola oryzae]TDV47847.1 hypothetical protein CLV71_10982 [Actinophytocola oryzae]